MDQALWVHPIGYGLNHCYTILVWLVILHPIACTIQLVNNVPRVYKTTRKYRHNLQI